MTKKKKHEIFVDHFSIPVFKERINLVFVKRSPHKALEALDLLVPFADDIFHGNVDEAIKDLKGANAMVVRVRDATVIILPFNVTAGVIAHEIFHLAVLVLRKRGLEFNDGSEEAYAHLIDWLTNEIYSYHKILMRKLAKERKQK